MSSVCREEAGEITRLYGVMEDEAESIICLYGSILLRALKPILDVLEYKPSMLKALELDAEGPRLVLKLSGDRIKEAYVDFSPDGTEHSITIELSSYARKAKPEVIEKALSRIIESDEEFTGVEEYDISFDPETLTLTITLISRLVSNQPGVTAVLRAVEKSIMSI